MDDEFEFPLRSLVPALHDFQPFLDRAGDSFAGAAADVGAGQPFADQQFRLLRYDLPGDFAIFVERGVRGCNEPGQMFCFTHESILVIVRLVGYSAEF